MKQSLDNVLIHIGYPKTATTWFQNQLFISENPVFEPLSRNSKGHSSLGPYFFRDEQGYPLSSLNSNEESIKREIEAIKQLKNCFDDKIPVLSHEKLSGGQFGVSSQRIACMLKQHFPQAKILIGIREQKSYMLSLYFQKLALGKTCSLTTYLKLKNLCSPYHLQYIPLILEYQKLYGKENVLVFPYEIFRDNPQLFLDSLSNFLSVKLDIKKDLFENVINDKPSLFALHYFRYLNAFRRARRFRNKSSFYNKQARKIAFLIYRIIAKIAPQQCDVHLKEKLKLEIEQWCGDRYVESNKELSQLINIDLAPYGYF